MWQYQKLTTLLALGTVAITTNIGCATTVEDPVVDEQAMSEDNAAESSEALTVGGWGGGYRGLHHGRFGYVGRGFHGRGLFGPPGRALGLRGRGYGGFYGDCGFDCGYGDYGDYDDYNDHQDINIIVEQNNGYGGYNGYDGYDDYEDYYDDYEPCGG